MSRLGRLLAPFKELLRFFPSRPDPAPAPTIAPWLRHGPDPDPDGRPGELVGVGRRKMPQDLPPMDALAQVRFDPTRCYYTSKREPALVFQTAVVDVLLVDDRMTRIRVFAAYDARTHDPRRISYVPLADLVASPQVVG